MRVAELIMLIVGALLFTVSFFMPDRGRGVAELDKEEERRQIKKLLEEGAGEAKFRVEEAVDDSVSDGVDKAERALDRMTNEKIAAINEYSDTVLGQIKTNHDEVMFLYDMLNNKHSQLKTTVAELNQATKSAKAATEESAQGTKGFGYVTPNPDRTSTNMGYGYTQSGTASVQNTPVSNATPKTVSQSSKQVSMEPVKQTPFEPAKQATIDSAKQTSFEPIKPVALDSKKEEDKMFEQIQKQLENAVSTEKTTSEPPKRKASKPKQAKTPVADGNLQLMFATDNNSANNNDRILELHKAGKSNMAIAKELGLGVGEVKLVIDLFEGI